MRTPALFLALVAAASATPAADPPDRLAALVKLYQAYDLPLPPKDAKLYHFDPKGGRASPAVGFGLEYDNERMQTKFLCGCETEWFKPEAMTELPFDAKQIPSKGLRFPTIIQIKVRGRHAVAEALLERWREQNEESPEQALALQAWEYWADQLCDSKADRATVARRMSAAMRAEPEAFEDEYYQSLYDGLLASLTPSKTKPGTVEAEIDELLDVSGVFLHLSHCSNPRYDAVVRRGFDAVPALIEHLDDDRLTRARTSFGPEGYPRVRHRVKNFISDILLGLMADEKAKTDDDGVVRTEDVKAWWAEASKVGEEEYAVGRVREAAKEGSGSVSHLLTLIVHKYPARLPELFRGWMAARPVKRLDAIAEFVADSSLPKETKRKLYLEAIGSKETNHQQVGRRRLRDVDPDRFHQLLLGELAKLPGTPSEPYHWCREATFAHDVGLTTDPAVWAAAEKYLRRADAGMKEVWLRTLSWATPPETRRQAIEFVAKFLSDSTVRDVSVKPELHPEWYAARPEYRKAEVRNVAAEALGRMLRLKTQPTPKWSADEWAKFRDEVAKAVKDELQPKR